MHPIPMEPPPFNSRRLYTGLFLGAAAVLIVDLTTRPTHDAAVLASLLTAAYVTLGIVGFDRVERVGRRWLTAAYFGLMLPLGAALFGMSPIGGTFLLLGLAAQSIRALPGWAALLVCVPLPFLHLPMGWPHALREGAVFAAALGFLYVQSRAIRTIERARIALDQANQQLRRYAAEREELAAERERNRIAREIHDGLGHYLTTIHMQLQATRAILDRDRLRADQTLAQAQHLAHEALADVRRSVGLLRSGSIDRPPLLEALRILVATTESAGLPATLVLHGSARSLGPLVEHTVERAAQEGLTNARKYAAATHVTLTLDYTHPTLLRLTVSDDGQGARTTDGGFGLISLRERAHLLGGRLFVATAPEQGFTFTLEVPG
jgi:signal transduction histidine kinase